MNYLIYLDPGSGSYLVQALVAGALGIVFFFKNIVNYIRGFFGLLTGRKHKMNEGETKTTEITGKTEPGPEN